MVSKRRVVVTGLGVISSIGIGKDEFWRGLLAGQSGISQISRFDTSNFDAKVGGEVKIFNPGDFFEAYEIEHLGRAAQFAIAAIELALKDAKLSSSAIAKQSSSLCLGTTMADAQAIESFDDLIIAGKCNGSAARRSILQYPSCMITAQAALRFHVKGRVVMLPTACAAGNYAIAYGSDLIRLKKADVVLAGGVDPFSRIAFTGFNRIFAVAPDRCQPFDRNRKGMIPGEGAAVLVLESLEHAQQRDALLYAEIRGYGTSCDAHHMTIPNVEGLVRVMRNALEDSHVPLDELDYISAHGTGTQANDRAESSAIMEIFGKRSVPIPVSSIKSMLGHTMGAASALEAVGCVLAVQHDRIPPTINFETPDPDCPIDCVPNVPRNSRVNIAMNNSFAFGGNNACVMFSKVEHS